MNSFFEVEATRQYLINYLCETEEVLTEALQQYDSSASSKIYPSLDLGFPHDVIRIAGGFATGSYVTWNCRVPFIPIDTTVNVCSSSIFELDTDISGILGETHFNNAIEKLKNSLYSLNYHRGNHFITLMRSILNGKNYLVLHSSAPEFKRNFNGLYPVEDNWLYDDIKVFRNGNRRIRYIVGKKAELFIKLAHQVEIFNTTRQEFIASTILDGLCEINDVKHHHHYYMPTDQSVMIGSFLLNSYETAPIFTYPGWPIFLFKVHPSKKNELSIMSEPKYLVPHGWGKTSKIPPKIEIDLDENKFILNGRSYELNSLSSLRDHADLTLRKFGLSESDEDYYFNFTSNYFEGEIVDKLEQIFTYNKAGFTHWRL